MNSLRRSLVGAALLALPVSGVIAKNASERSTAPAPFHALKSDFPGDFELVVGAEHTVRISAESHVLKQIKSEIRNGTLIVAGIGSFSTEQPVRIRITAPSIDSIALGGAANLTGETSDSGHFSIVCTDSASITLNKLNVGVLTSDIVGSSNVSLTGNVTRQQVTVRDSGSYEASELQSQSASVEVRGSGSAVLNVAENLIAAVKDAGSVEYQGSPTLNQTVEDAGSINKL